MFRPSRNWTKVEKIACVRLLRPNRDTDQKELFSKVISRVNPAEILFVATVPDASGTANLAQARHSRVEPAISIARIFVSLIPVTERAQTS